MTTGRVWIGTDYCWWNSNTHEASFLGANEPGHLSDDDGTAGSQPDLMQWVNATDLAWDAS